MNDTTIVGLDTLINIPDTLVNLVPGDYGYSLTDGNGCLAAGIFNVANLDSLPQL